MLKWLQSVESLKVSDTSRAELVTRDIRIKLKRRKTLNSFSHIQSQYYIISIIESFILCGPECKRKQVQKISGFIYFVIF